MAQTASYTKHNTHHDVKLNINVSTCIKTEYRINFMCVTI